MIRRTIRRDENGATVVEFALVAPVLVTLLLGLFDIGYNMYVASVLQGAIQKAARDSSIEGATPAMLDGRVTSAVHDISPGATVRFSRKSYASFSDVSTPEDFTDLNGDNVCNNGEPFEDANGNNAWDTDRGVDGLGGARDAVLYTVDVAYPRAFPVAGLLGLPEQHEMKSATVLRNQPYAQQATRVTAGNCT